MPSVTFASTSEPLSATAAATGLSAKLPAGRSRAASRRAHAGSVSVSVSVAWMS